MLGNRMMRFSCKFLGPQSLCFQRSSQHFQMSCGELREWHSGWSWPSHLGLRSHRSLGDLAVAVEMILSQGKTREPSEPSIQFLWHGATMVSNLLGINHGKPGKMRKKHEWGSLPHAVRYCQNRANYGQLWHIYFENHAVSDYSGDLESSLVIRRMILQAAIKMTSFRKGPIATFHATLALLLYLIPRRGWSKSDPGSAAIISRILDRILRLEWKPSATGDSLKVIKVNESSSAFDFHATMLQHVESWFLRSTQGPFGRSCPSVQGPTSRAVG